MIWEVGTPTPDSVQLEVLKFSTNNFLYRNNPRVSQHTLEFIHFHLRFRQSPLGSDASYEIWQQTEGPYVPYLNPATQPSQSARRRPLRRGLPVSRLAFKTRPGAVQRHPMQTAQAAADYKTRERSVCAHSARSDQFPRSTHPDKIPFNAHLFPVYSSPPPCNTRTGSHARRIPPQTSSTSPTTPHQRASSLSAFSQRARPVLTLSFSLSWPDI